MSALGKISVPDYSTLCRRQDRLPVEASKHMDNGENLHIGIDSTELKVGMENPKTQLVKTSNMDENEYLY
ncbi:hypothetical protein AGMMS49940_08180 [Spirochaetia bacterium]|nr:hypothetical protein AGMMS49940_08180 [Spirochaetia bacterium]